MFSRLPNCSFFIANLVFKMACTRPGAGEHPAMVGETMDRSNSSLPNDAEHLERAGRLSGSRSLQGCTVYNGTVKLAGVVG